MEFNIPVTQQFLNSQDKVSAFLAGLLATVPTFKFGQLLNVFSRDLIAQKVLDMITASFGVTLSITLQEVIFKLLTDGLKVGDVITIKGGKVVSITLAGSSSGSAGGGGNSSGGSYNVQTLADIFPSIGQLITVCQVVYTKSGDGQMVPQQVCYIR